MTNPSARDSVPKELTDSILKAITGALQEEKLPKGTRYLKIILLSLLASLAVGLPIFFAFGGQMNWIGGGAILLWSLCLFVGFGLYFQPQPRLIVPGFWSPVVFARLILFSTLAAGAQILICPSFVFLDSPLSWNPLEGVTGFLMSHGGMSLCMTFCGFFFSFVSGLAGITSIHRVLPGKLLKRLPYVVGILLITQIPLVWIQAMDDFTRGFLWNFVSGSLLGVVLSFLITFAVKHLSRNEQKKIFPASG